MTTTEVLVACLIAGVLLIAWELNVINRNLITFGEAFENSRKSQEK